MSKQMVKVLAVAVMACGCWSAGSRAAAPRTVEVHAASAQAAEDAVNTAPAALAAPALEIVQSDPPDGFIDVRADRDGQGTLAGVQELTVRFSRGVTLSAADVTVTSSTGDTPSVAAVAGEGSDWTVLLTGPVPGGATLTVTFAGQCAWTMHSRPGDINGDEVSDARDTLALKAALTGGQTDPERHDVDRSGAVTEQDVAALNTLLRGDAATAGWGGVAFADGGYICCCHAVLGCTEGPACPDGGYRVPCPCTPESCIPSSEAEGQ